MPKRAALTRWLVIATVALCAGLADARIANLAGDARWRFFMNVHPPLTAQLPAWKPQANIDHLEKTSYTGRKRGPQSNMNMRAFETPTNVGIRP